MAKTIEEGRIDAANDKEGKKPSSACCTVLLFEALRNLVTFVGLHVILEPLQHSAMM